MGTRKRLTPETPLTQPDPIQANPRSAMQTRRGKVLSPPEDEPATSDYSSSHREAHEVVHKGEARGVPAFLTKT